MNTRDLEARIKNIDERTQRIEQILPTLATKDDLKGFPTKDDPKGFVTKDDLKGFPTEDDPKGFATKDDLKAFATKEDLKEELKAYPTREEMTTAIREEGTLTRAHFNAVAERIEASVKSIAEGHDAMRAYGSARLTETNTELAAHDRRIMKLEAESIKRR